MVRKTIADNIKKTRLIAGISQKELVRKIGRSETYIRDAENVRNDISVSELEKIAEVLKVPMMKLLDESYGEEKSAFDDFQKLRIYNLDDRITISGILIKNGYTVSQMKQKKTETGKVLDYFLAVKLEDENADTAR